MNDQGRAAFLDEEWRPIADCDGHEVSSLGRVRSWLSGNRWRTPLTAPVLRIPVMKKGYLRIALRHSATGKHRRFFVHVLVLNAFVGPCQRGHQCRHHPDPSRTNNALANISWGTQAENDADKVAHGRIPRGAECATAKLTEEKVSAIRLRALEGVRDAVFSAEMGVSKATIQMARTGGSWAHLTDPPPVRKYRTKTDEQGDPKWHSQKSRS